ncbi:DUF5362 family protein [Pseudobacteroides cellulosolvens]|uniref:Uncharacterized protein n=1 Tax=Pseudobacteroides cellulosolvens ATCC 35603 = DSM 2933 TaxID=398512 RepID=A0A0L6JUE7_9FIRM|nr:DUF5362 family protein [Pseudobacteroides cellulosolvens]KNY29344.1 hypothetical protein Bccel_4618 [Pseudobacteroides cellulosolvens ATCC 35603 = DSM 2933]
MEDLDMYQKDQYNQYNQYNQNNQNSQNNNGLSISQSDLRSLAGWAKFIAIVQIICAAIMCLGVLAIIINPVAIIYPGIGAVIIIMALKLLNAANSIRRFIDTGDYYSLSNSLQDFKSYFKMNGILMIIGIAFTILIVILAIVAIGTFGSMLNDYRFRY